MLLAVTDAAGLPGHRDPGRTGLRAPVRHRGGRGGSGSPLRVGIDAAVDWFLARPDLRVKLVPPNSRRQALARRAIDELHRRF